MCWPKNRRPSAGWGPSHKRLRSAFQNPTRQLIALDRLEQRLEVAFAEAVVALALDELEEHRPELGFGEDLQQQALVVAFDLAVDQQPARLQCADISPWPGRRPSSIS
jgi:hypothetical protein